jgi:hypothetical protein
MRRHDYPPLRIVNIEAATLPAVLRENLFSSLRARWLHRISHHALVVLDNP